MIPGCIPAKNEHVIFSHRIIKVTPLELTTKLMEAAKEKGAELRIATVSKVATSPVEAAEPEGGGKAGQEDGGDERVTAVVLEDGEEVPCDRVGQTISSETWRFKGIFGGLVVVAAMGYIYDR